jgi:hypothetical protein
MNEKTRFWILLVLFVLSVALLLYLNYTDGKVFIGQ